MAQSPRRIGSVLGAAGGLALGLLLAWLFSRQGTRGLAEWVYGSLFLALGLGAALSISLGLADFLPAAHAKPRFRKALSVSSGILGFLCAALSLGVLGFVQSRALSAGEPVPPLRILDPGLGVLSLAGASGEDKEIIRISISSDAHWGKETANPAARSAVLKSLAEARPRRDAFFLLGDTTEMGMNESEWQAAALELSATLPETPIRALLGNHDGLVNGEVQYRRYFAPRGHKTDSGSPYYYSLDAGPALIIVLNLLWGAESFDAAQRRWLERTLDKAAPERQVIVLSHCFFLSSGYVDEDTGMPWYDHYGTMEKVAPILEKYGVDLVVSGHNHYMELLERKGVRYAVIGALGGKPDPLPSYRSPHSLWFAREVFGRLDVDILRDGLYLAFVDQNGSPLHTAFIPADS